MNSSDEENTFPARVAKVRDNGKKVIINKGSRDGIEKGQKFLVYNLEEEEIMDPQTGESLGRVENIKGEGKVTHVQEKLSTLETTKTKSTELIPTIRMVYGFKKKTREKVPFENPEKGDLVKPVPE